MQTPNRTLLTQSRIFSFAQLVQSYAQDMVRGTQSSCNLSIPETLWMIDGDEELIRQAIANILINAIQAMPNGGLINVSCENVHVLPGDMLPLREGRYVKATIKDQGVGIPQEHLAKIFDPYFATKTACRGMGLPLASAIIKKHRGHVSLHSSIDSGTTCTVYLPASDKTEVEENSEQNTVKHSKKRILIMDDDEMLLNMVGMMLERLGYNAEFALDGQQAIEKYRNALQSESPFAAVIMDLIVPTGMGGREAMQVLLELDPQIKVIVSSGYVHNSVIEDYQHYGFKDVLIKPYRASDLEKVLDGLLGVI